MHVLRILISVVLGMVFLVGLAGLCGCVDPAARPLRESDIEKRFADEGRRIAADPTGYLRELARRCETLRQYRLTFHRQERIGLIPALQPAEEIEAIYRRQPHSVSFRWHDPQAPYCQAVYVQGRHDDKLLIRERKGVLFMPPQVRVLDVEAPVQLGRSRNPITAFGLEQLVARTLAPFEDPALKDVMTIAYEGVVPLEPAGRPAHHLLITRPPTPGYRYTQQDFYVDAETGWPAGTDLWLENGQLDARYRYSDVDTNVTLTDEDFELGPCPS